jgi:hypothetical protein
MFENDIIDNIISSYSSNYRYTKDDINNFFASDNGQEEIIR